MSSFQKIEWPDDEISSLVAYLITLEASGNQIEDLAKPDQDTSEIDKTLEEVTIGLAKAVSDDDTDEVDIETDKEKLEEIIEFEQIPKPLQVMQETNVESDSVDVISKEEIQFEGVQEVVEDAEEVAIDETIDEIEIVEDTLEPAVIEQFQQEEKLTVNEVLSQDTTDEGVTGERIDDELMKDASVEASLAEAVKKALEKPMEQTESAQEEKVLTTSELLSQDEDFITKKLLNRLESEDLTAKIVTNPLITEPVEVTPESIPEDVRSLLVEPEAVEPEAVEPEAVEPEAVEPEAVEPEPVEPEPVEPEPVEPEPVEPEPVEPELTEEELKAKRREEIIQKMLLETKKREEEEGIMVRDMGETAGKTYSAVIVGTESSKNMKNWKKRERKKKSSKGKKK